MRGSPAVNAVFAEKGIVLPLTSGQTVTEESRLLDGIAAQKSIFGDHIDAMRAAAPENQKNIQDDLTLSDENAQGFAMNELR